MDTLDLIRTFQEVARRGSFADAARALDVSRAKVSKYVAELEARLDARLFHRSTRTVSLTDAGTLLLERSNPLMEMIDLTRVELQERSSTPAGRMRVALPHGLAQTALPGLLNEFMLKYPAVHLSLHLDSRLVDLVDEGIDLALRVGRIGDANMIVRKLQPIPMAVAAAPAYWTAHGLPAQPDDLADHVALTYSPLGPNPQWRFDVDGEAVSVAVHSRMDANDARPLVDAAMRGLGVIYMPQLLMQPQLDSGALQAVLAECTPRDVWLYAAYAQRRHNSAALKALLSFLEENWQPV